MAVDIKRSTDIIIVVLETTLQIIKAAKKIFGSKKKKSPSVAA